MWRWAWVVLVAAGCGPKGQEFVAQEGRYRVTFPAAPTTSSQPAEGRGTVHTATLALRSGALTVAWEDVVGKPELSDRERLELGVKGALAAVDGKARRKKDMPLAGGHTGRQVLIERDGRLVAEVRLYLVKGRLYQLLAVGEAWWLESPEVRQFFASFAVDEG